MVPLKATVQFSNIETFESAKYDESVKKFCEELQWMATALKNAR
jgi:hypothetical protein